jgi:uncharacterized protein (DUF1015 family)
MVGSMAVLRPFTALRPRAGLAARIAAVPYDVVNTDEARALATDPLSFLHASRAEIDLPPGTDPYSDAVYARAAANFGAMKRESLELEDRPAVYLYRLKMGSHVQTGVAACFSVDEYRHDLIKKHEKTRPDKENDRTRHIVETRAQSGPVLLTYRGSPAVESAVAAGVEGEPLYAFTAADGIEHTVWRASVDVAEAIVRAFADVPALYIADGHHRAASAARAYDQLDGGPNGEAAWFLAVAFPGSSMQILPYHRVVKDLGGRSADAFLADVAERVPLGPGQPTSPRKGTCELYLGGRWHALDLGAAPTHGDPVAALDVQRLQDHVLAPILGIVDPRTDKRIDFVGGIRGAGELTRLVDSGQAAAAFAMYPTTVEDLIAIADAGGIMPPKSTWFEPKLRDGLLTHVI